MSFTESLDLLRNGLSVGLGLAGGDEDAQPSATFLAFNQDVTSITVGTSEGYRLYSLGSTDKMDLIYESQGPEVFLAERLFSSSLVALVNCDSPRTLCILHFKKGSEICRYSYSEKIRAVRMNRARLVVCLEDSLYIHNICDMKVIHTIKETPPNAKGLIALSTNSDKNYLAYPGHSTIGELQIFDTVNLYSRVSIPAHEGQLAALEFAPDGTRIATASDKGTVIRVFSCETGTKLYELRRGLKRTASIYSLSFSPCGSFLACSSNTETVHIFRLEDKPKESGALCGSPSDDLFGYIHSMVSASAGFLPSQMTDTLLQGRAFATVHHTLAGSRNKCALVTIKHSMRLLLASQTGVLYIYHLDPVEGGDCSLIQKFLLAEEPNPVSPGAMAEEEEKCIPGELSPSYADRLRNRSPGEMTESEKFHEMRNAAETPPKQCFLLDDDGEFPPVSPS